MSERVCYIQRSDRGGALRGVRLIGGHTDETWRAGAATDPSLVSQAVHESADWIRDRLSTGGTKSRLIKVVCLDPDGAVCSWVKPEDADPTLIDAAITNGLSEYDPDALEPALHSGISERFPRLPLELSFELLATDETSNGSRAAVMACPDVPGRLLKDELDAMGIRVDCFTSLWHAIANVWDPGSDGNAHSAQRIVASDAPIAATIMVDDQDGRLIWTWSRAGRLITAGSSRLRHLTRSDHDHQSSTIIRDQDISRVCADWLGWSSQLGISPSRIVFVGATEHSPKSHGSLLDSDKGSHEHEPRSDQHHDTEHGLSPTQIGAAISRAWPEATIDLLEHEDPIVETLRLIATGQRGQGLVSLDGLTSRPGRVHRSMYRWAGAALVAVSAALGIFAYQLYEQSRVIQDETSTIDIDRMTLFNDFDPTLAISAIPTFDLQTKLNELRRSQGPLVVARSKPIMQELETLSYVFGIPGIEVDQIRLNNSTVTVTLKVKDLAQAEQISQSLVAIKGSNLRWNTMSPKNIGSGENARIEATYSGIWVEESNQ